MCIARAVNSCDGELDTTAATAVALVGKRRARGKGRRIPTRRQQVRGTAFCLMNGERAVLDSLPGASGEIRVFFFARQHVLLLFINRRLNWHVGSRPSQALAQKCLPSSTRMQDEGEEGELTRPVQPV